MIKVIKDKIIPKELILSSAAYLKQLEALRRQKTFGVTLQDLT
jgi:antitoxin component of RelBE/YafQ-DinJ toxin-antitoxin module